MRSFKLDEFWKQCQQCFWDYPSEVLQQIFETKMAVVKAIIENGGDNTYKMPRKRQRE